MTHARHVEWTTGNELRKTRQLLQTLLREADARNYILKFERDRSQEALL